MRDKQIKRLYNKVCKLDKDDSIFGFYYKEENGKETLGVNGGDWMGKEISDVIDKWGNKNNVNVVYEAEVDDEYFLEQGFKSI